MNTPSPLPSSFSIPPDAFQSSNAADSYGTFANADFGPYTGSIPEGLDLEGANALFDSNTPISDMLGFPGMSVPGYASLDPTWTFICTPDEISWTTSNAVNRVEMFGTNNPPAISGTKGMREFNLNNALVEGFTRNKKVEAKVAALEDLMKYKSPTTGGYVNVPVYQVWANQKGYGQQAFFLIKSVQVKETMRDLAGDATRAYVDVSFVEVPAYQVDSGIDQAPFSQQGSKNPLVSSYSQALTNQVTTATAAFNAAANQNKPNPPATTPR